MTSEEFREARLRLGLTQKQLGKAMGMQQNAVSRIETGGAAPTKQQAAFIANLLEKTRNEHAEKSVAYHYGEALAIIDVALKDHHMGHGLQPTELGQASIAPVNSFGPLMARAVPKMTGPKARLHDMMGDVLDNVQQFPDRLSIAEQGEFWIGYNHMQSRLRRGVMPDEQANDNGGR